MTLAETRIDMEQTQGLSFGALPKTPGISKDYSGTGSRTDQLIYADARAGRPSYNEAPPLAADLRNIAQHAPTGRMPMLLCSRPVVRLLPPKVA